MSHDIRLANFNVVFADTNTTIDQLIAVKGSVLSLTSNHTITRLTLQLWGYRPNQEKSSNPHFVKGMAQLPGQTRIPKRCKRMVTQTTQPLRNQVGLHTSWNLNWSRYCSSNEGWLWQQALIVHLRLDFDNYKWGRRNRL